MSTNPQQGGSLLSPERRSAVPEEQNPNYWGPDGRLTLEGMRAMIRAGKGVRWADRIITREEDLPSISQYALVTGDRAVVTRTRQQIEADIQRQRLELQLLDQYEQEVDAGQTAQRGQGIDGAQFPSSQPSTGAGFPSQTITQTSQVDEPYNLNKPGTGTPSPATSGTATTADITGSGGGEGGQQQQGGAADLPTDFPGRAELVADGRFTTLDAVAAASKEDLDSVKGVGEKTIEAIDAHPEIKRRRR